MAGVMKFYGFEWSSASHASPELSSAQSCFKGAITIANIVFLVSAAMQMGRGRKAEIFGCVLCGVGGYAMQSKAGDLAGETLPTGIIVIGVFIICISLLGCVAAYKESRIMLAIYSVFLLIFTIILFFVGIAVYVKKDSAEEYIADGWCAASSTVVQGLQEYFDCCGLYAFNDSIAYTDASGSVAGCVHASKNYVAEYVSCPSGMTSSTGLACLAIMVSSFESAYVAAGACAIAFAVIMGAGMIVVCVLMSAIKEKRHLEDIRKLHRKLREAKEDPAHAGMRGLAPMGGGMDDAGYGEVDLNAQEPLDSDVSINMEGGVRGEIFDNAHEQASVAHYTPGSSTFAPAPTFAAAPPTKVKRAKKHVPEPEPELDEQPYEERYEEEHTAGYAPQADEYDEDD